MGSNENQAVNSIDATMTRNSNILQKCESLFYLLTWAGSIAYSIYKLSFTSNYLSNYQDLYADFSPGWSWIGKKQDVSDHEWRVWIPLIFELIPWICFHHSVSQIIKVSSSSMLLCCWYISTSLAFLHYYIGPSGTLCILAQPSVLYFLTYKRSKFTMWSIHILFLLIIHFLKIPDGLFQKALGFNDEQQYILTLTMCWIQLRCISYNMDRDNCSDSNHSSVVDFLSNFLWKLAYCLYLPTLSLGPLILYHEFVDSVKGPYEQWNARRLGYFTLNLMRYTCWIYFVKFFLHFVYFNAIQYYPEVIQILSPWALYGLGYCMGQFFLIKYVVVYGLNHHLCAIDDVKAPPQPKCIARIHLYSDMWKYFDRGLYKFLVRYIYTPLLERNLNKLFASFLCFTFVFLWHGMQMNIFIWALLNFIGLTVEGLARSIGKTKQFSDMEKKFVSLENAKRFKCMLASPLLAMSALSNFYFFAGQEIGDIYVQRIFHESWNNLLFLLLVLYCCCQVSVNITSWELQQCPKKSERC